MTAARRWYQPGLADLIFLLVALSVMRGAKGALLDDPGVGWHLRNIDAMIAHGGWLTEDPFTDPRGEAPRRWLTNQWLGELPAWLGWKWAGLEGIGAVNALALALLGRWLYTALIDDGLPWPLAVGWTFLGMMGTSCSWNARPNVFTVLLVFLTARTLVRLREGKVRWGALWLLPLFAAWANVHGGFVAGLMMIAVAFGLEAMSAMAGNAAARGRAAILLLLGAGAGLATLVNPYGIGLYRWVGLLLGDPFFMGLHQEWRSPDFHSAGAVRYELLLLLFPALLAVTARRPNLIELALSILWLHFALTGFRYVALWVVVAVPLMARSSAAIEWANAWAVKAGLSTQPGSLYHTPREPSPWLWSAVVAVALLGGAKALEGRYAAHNQEIIASRMLDRFLTHLDEWQEKNDRRPVIFHSYDWGGYLTWKGWPRVLNWIDDRNEVQGKERIEEYFAVMRAEPGWAEQLRAVDWACIAPNTPLARALTADERWQKVDEDGHAVIFVRRSVR